MLLRTTFCQSWEKFDIRKYCLIIVSLVLVSIQLHAQNGWTNKGNILTLRGGASACVIDNKIFVLGGNNGSPNFTDLAVNEVYDPATNTWEVKASLPSARGWLSSAVVNGIIYAIGGGYPTATQSLYAYDPATNSWTSKANMLTSRLAAQAGVIDGIIYNMGGNQSERNCEAYDPITNTWTAKTPIPAGGGGDLAVTVYNGLIYTFGGGYYTVGAHPNVYAYNPQTDIWTQKQSMPTARFGLQTYLVNGKIYAIGGSQADYSSLGTVEVYYPDTDTWVMRADMPFTDVFFAGAIVNDKIYVIGGTADWATGVLNVWEYDPAYVVPVELISFTGNIVDGKVLLEWSTSTETNNKGFEIYRNGKKISFVDGKGTTTEKHDYSFLDAGLNAGLYNYRLNQIDFDGTQKVVGEVTVNLIIPEQFSLEQNYPNPFNPSTSIQYGVGSREFVNIKVYDLLGNEVAVLVNEEKPTGTYEVTWNAENISSGVYYYQLKAGNFISTKKMLMLK